MVSVMLMKREMADMFSGKTRQSNKGTDWNR